MNEIVTTIFGLAGGLAMFLFGMNSMSDALQRAAGEKMKKVLAFLTRNPVMGAIAGMLVTSVLQSSSATTVMVIGFVSADLMTLPQAISVIFGANIGTTMTAQLLAFKISDYIYPIIFIGFMMSFLSKKDTWKNIGMVIFSFGILFEGIDIMGSVMKPLASSAFFVDLMGKVRHIPILGVLLGMCMTLVVQSSSATIAVLQNFASQAGPDGVSSVIGLTGAIPILLGDNIGTTITALLASIGQTKNAKRTAIAHTFFNVSGTIVFMFIIPWFANFVRWISPKGREIDIISRQIANAHTTFNVVCTLVWLPLIPLMVKLVTTVIPGDDKKPESGTGALFLDDVMLTQPVTAMYLVSRELHAYAENVLMLMSSVKRSVGSSVADAEKEYAAYAQKTDGMEKRIVSYITRLFAEGGMTSRQSERAAGLMFIAGSVGHVHDRCLEIHESVSELRNGGKTLTDTAVDELAQCFDIAEVLFSQAMDSVETGDSAEAALISKGRKKMRKAQKQFNKAHLARVRDQKCDASLTEKFSGILYGLERIVDNSVEIAEETMDNVRYVTVDDTGVDEKNLHLPEEQRFPKREFQKAPALAVAGPAKNTAEASEGEKGGTVTR